MAPTTPTGFPASVRIGDSIRFRIPDHADYPQSEGWDLQVWLQGDARLVDDTDITVAFQSSGDDAYHWLVTADQTATSTLTIESGTEGRYRWIGRFAGSGDYAGRYETVYGELCLVEQNPAAAATSFQTHNERTLAVIEAALESRLTSDIENYQIAGRAVSKIPVADLVKLRAHYAAAVKIERSGRLGRAHQIHFTRVA